eukprot:gene6284-6356_t
MQHSAVKSRFTDDVLDWVGVSNLRAFSLLAFISLCLFLPGFFTLQPMDRDEPRFAQATKQMLETGDFISIRFQDEARNKKPDIWLYRLPSLLAAIASVYLTYWAALAVTDRRKALVAAVLMATCLLLGVEARLAKTDAVLTATTIACFGALMRLNLRRTLVLPHVLVFWTALAAGILIKGPITPLIVLLAMAVLSFKERSIRWLNPIRPGLGLVLCLLVVLPWFILIGIKTQGAFFAQSIGQDMLNKVAQGQESHGAPPLTYFGLFWLTAWPMAPLALLAAPFVWRLWRDPKNIVLLAWLMPAWVMFEAVPTKLPHYVLPLYPAIAILTAVNIDNIRLNTNVWLRGLSGILAFLVPVGLVLVGLVFWLQTAFPLLPQLASIPAPVSTALVYVPVMIGCSPIEAVAKMVAFAALFFVLAYSSVLTSPAFAPFALSQRLTATREQIRETSSCLALDAIGSARFAEPSFVFLNATDIRFADGQTAAEFINGASCRLAFVERAEEPAFAAALKPELNLKPVTRIADVSVVVPVRNETGNIESLITEIASACAAFASYEIVYVNDGSSDGTAAELAQLQTRLPALRVLHHAQSCGQSAAVRTGVRAARSPIVVTLDGDGQNNPAFIPDIVRTLKAAGTACGMVQGQRLGRKDTGFKRFQSRLANKVRGAILQDGTRDTGCGLKCFYRTVYLALPYFDALHRFMPALVKREGYSVAHLDVVDRPRHAGVSNYGFFDRLWVGIIDLIGVRWLIRRRKRVPQVSETGHAG